MGGDKFIVTFDPLDGSSIIDVNWSVGTIVCVWPNENQLIGQSGRNIITAAIAVYGPRTTVLWYNPETQAVEEFAIKRDNEDKKFWFKTKEKTNIGDKAKMFSPANLRASSDNKAYEKLLEYWRQNKYTLRYTGGLVPDVYQMFVKGQGVFANPVSEACPAKLRLLYEVAPISFLVEKAGGKSSNGKHSIMDIKVENYTQKSPLCVGSSEEVDRFETFLLENK